MKLTIENTKHIRGVEKYEIAISQIFLGTLGSLVAWESRHNKENTRTSLFYYEKKV